MLRVRPLVHTSDPAAAAGFLRALGLSPALDPAPNGSFAVFDAGSGRLALHRCVPGSPADGTTALGFEVGDVREFARRTAEAGTAVVLTEEGGNLAARVTAPDGTSFSAGAGPRETRGPASPLSVLAVWSTPDVGPAATVLEDIGAKPRTGPGTWRDFRAKNGGLAAARRADRIDVALAFEYGGDVRDLLAGLIGDGFGPVVVEGATGRSLCVPSPWGAEVRISEAAP
ncbi:VOC family protein [Arthrobacter sp. TMS1-12-1]